MNPRNSVCLSESELSLLLSNDLPPDETAFAEQHIAECETCRSAIESMIADSFWWDDAKQSLASAVRPLDAIPVAASLRGAEDSRVEDISAEAASLGETRLRENVLDLLGPTDDPNMLGRIGPYEIIGLLGQGGMGAVFKGFDRSLNRFVAIKMLLPHLAASGAARKRFAREGQAVAAVVDDHVMAIHCVDEWQGVPYLVMTYSRGVSLQKRLSDNGPLEVREILRIGLQAAKGLAAAHAQGIVHRDIKPANIFLDQSVERVQLMDFGLARAVDDASLTRSGTLAGTPQYMSPEQARAETVDHRSDLFSLGCVIYAMCTGHAPFRAESSYSVLRLITDKEPRPIRELNSDIPEWLCVIISKLMAKQASDRFESAREVSELLEGCLAHVQQPTATPLPEAAAALAPQIYRRRPLRKFIAAAFGALALVFAGIMIVLELSKGTLTIESELADVPIRIVQGDKVVDRLTVTKSGNSVRVAAGTYVVELETKLDGMVVENDHILLKRGATEQVKIRYSKTATGTNDGSSTLHFETPDALMKHVADCQSKGDGPGIMACWTDQPFKDLVPSYLLTSLMQLQYFENAPPGDKPRHPEELVELKQILTEEFGGNEAGKALLTLAMAHKEIADRSADKFAEAAEATAESPLVQLLASSSAHLINSRSFIMKIDALYEKYKEPDAKQEPKVYAYTIEQDGDKAVATEITCKHKYGLIKTDAGWRINDIFYGLKAEDEIASLQGEWEFISVESDGVIREYNALKMQPSGARLTIAGDVWTVQAGNGTNVVGSGGNRVEIEGNKLTFHGMTTMPSLGSNDEIPTIGYGLYEVDGDTLKYLMTPAVAESALNGQSEPPIQFPETFETKGTGNNVFRLRKAGVRESAAGDVNTSSNVPQDVNAFDARTLDDVTSIYNERTRQLRTELFDPPIADLTADQMRAAMLDAAEQYRRQGRVEIASALKTSAETNRLSDRLRFMGMSGTMSDGFRQITPTFQFELASNSAFSVILPKAELRYSLNGWSSKTWGDIHPPLTGHWELVSIEERGETLTQAEYEQWRQKHASWTKLTIDVTSLTMSGDNASVFDLSIDYDSGNFPQYAIGQDGNTKYSGVLMGNGFIDDTTLVIAINIEGNSQPTTFNTQDGTTTNLNYRRVPGNLTADAVLRSNARSVVEAYVASALAGDVAKATTLAKNSPSDSKRIKELRDFLNVQRLKIETVYVNDPAKPTQALATSIAVKLDDDHKQPDGRRDGLMVFTLELADDRWFVIDIDFETESGAEKELENFIKANPNSIGLPPQSQSLSR